MVEGSSRIAENWCGREPALDRAAGRSVRNNGRGGARPPVARVSSEGTSRPRARYLAAETCGRAGREPDPSLDAIPWGPPAAIALSGVAAPGEGRRVIDPTLPSSGAATGKTPMISSGPDNPNDPQIRRDTHMSCCMPPK